jgi:hypothetical protein
MQKDHLGKFVKKKKCSLYKLHCVGLKPVIFKKAPLVIVL